eukprot:Gb_10167 [translate_table: standard]
MLRCTRSPAFLVICHFSLIYFLIFFAPAAAHSLSEEGLHSFSAGSRSLLQNKKSCPIGFEFRNYTILTSQCKGPDYNKTLCCTAFKQFACPVAQYINDLTTDCAATMFSYINLHGQYPPALFASLCQEGTQGLECDAESPDSTVSKASDALNANQVVRNFLAAICLATINLLGVMLLS